MSRFLSRAGEQIAELAELTADEGRLSRGRALFRKGSIADLSIVEGSVTASVRGSQGDVYETTISTTLAPQGVRRQVANGSAGHRSVDDLIGDGIDVCPREIDLVFDCDCADWDEPCKHVVAVFLAFADRVDLDEAELLRWRGLDSPVGPGPDPEVGTEPEVGTGPKPEEPDVPARTTADRRVSTRRASTDPGEAPDAVDRSAKLSELESLLGDSVVRLPTAADDEDGPPPPTLEPALAAFLGVGTSLDPVDVGDITTVAPLFTSVELGPLADLGPELAAALATIAARLEDPRPEGPGRG